MEIFGTIPEKREKLSAIPLSLFSLEYTAYNQFHRDIVALSDSKQIIPTIFEKTSCHTTEFHMVAKFIKYDSLFEPKDSTDGHLVTYLMYNETHFYFTHNTRFPREAFLKAKILVHPDIEIIKLNRYRLIKLWRDNFNQPFELKLKYLEPTMINNKYL